MSMEQMSINRKMPFFIYDALKNDPRCMYQFNSLEEYNLFNSIDRSRYTFIIYKYLFFEIHPWKEKVVNFYEKYWNPEKFVKSFEMHLNNPMTCDPIFETFSDMHRPIMINWNLPHRFANNSIQDVITSI